MLVALVAIWLRLLYVYIYVYIDKETNLAVHTYCSCHGNFHMSYMINIHENMNAFHDMNTYLLESSPMCVFLWGREGRSSFKLNFNLRIIFIR